MLHGRSVERKENICSRLLLKAMKLKDALRAVLSPQELELLVGSYDVVGDIAIIIIPPELSGKENLIAATILSIHKHIRTVAKRAGNYDGEFRTHDLAVIGGESLRETEHRENGVRFFLNPAKVYYSVRSSSERKRVADLVEPGEDVLVLFSGVGAFPLVIAAHSRAREVIGIEKNPCAHRFAQKSLAANKRIKNVVLYEGDILDVLPRLGRVFDRVLMPLPKSASDYLENGLAAVRPGGWLHFYDFQPSDAFFQAVAKIEQACAENHRLLTSSKAVICGHCSPRIYRICVDARIE
jgi:tRNA (guanine37-N1)-methyltransferase